MCVQSYVLLTNKLFMEELIKCMRILLIKLTPLFLFRRFSFKFLIEGFQKKKCSKLTCRAKIAVSFVIKVSNSLNMYSSSASID